MSVVDGLSGSGRRRSSVSHARCSYGIKKRGVDDQATGREEEVSCSNGDERIASFQNAFQRFPTQEHLSVQSVSLL